MLTARTIVLSWLVLGSVGAGVAAEVRDIEVLVDRMDRLYRSETSFAELEMEIRTPHWRRTLRMKMWTEGMRKTLRHDSGAEERSGYRDVARGHTDVELFSQKSIK